MPIISVMLNQYECERARDSRDMGLLEVCIRKWRDSDKVVIMPTYTSLRSIQRYLSYEEKSEEWYEQRYLEEIGAAERDFTIETRSETW